MDNVVLPVQDAPDLCKLPIFAGLTVEARNFLLSHARQVELAAGEWIVRPGERGDFLGFVTDGKAALQDASGRVQMVGPGQAFGEAMMRYGAPAAFGVRALAPTTVWKISRGEWLTARRLGWEATGRKGYRRGSWRRRGALFAALCLLLAGLILGPMLAGWTDSIFLDVTLRAQRPDLAQAYLERAVSLRPRSAALHDALGYLLYTQGQVVRAVAQFQHALELDDSLASAHNNLGAAQLANGQATEAIASLQTAIDLDPGYAEALTNLGNAYLAIGNPQDAMAAYQRAFTLDPHQYTAQAQWAGLALQQGLLDEARQAWLKVIAAQPQMALAHQGLGAIAVLEGRPQAALGNLETARDLEPADPLTHLYLGLAMQALGRPLEAAYEFVLAQRFTQDVTLNNLAKTHLDQVLQELIATRGFQKGGASTNFP